MTKEEAKSCIGTIEMLQRLAYNIHGVMDVTDADNCKKIIEVLMREPCEDCVSRQAVDRLAWEYLRKPTDENVAFYERFLELPSVTPQEPKESEKA